MHIENNVFIWDQRVALSKVPVGNVLWGLLIIISVIFQWSRVDNALSFGYALSGLTANLNLNTN